MDVMQTSAFLFYFNSTSLPQNYENILKDMQLSNSHGIINPLAQRTLEYPENYPRFMFAKVTPYCLNNGVGRYLIVLAVSIVLYLILKTIDRFVQITLVEVFIEKIEFSLFLRFFKIFMLENTMNVLLNLVFNSTDDNWKGTNTIVSMALIVLMGIFQIGQNLVIYFKEYFGNDRETQTLFGSLTDGMDTSNRKYRILITNQELIIKVFMNYGILY